MSRSRRGVRRKRTFFETAVLVISLAAAAAVVGGLLVSGLTGPSGPADLSVAVQPTEARGSGGVVYEVIVSNRGGQTAENVVIEVTAGDETRELEILSVSKQDEEIAAVIFPAGSDPPTARVLSYHETTRG